MFRSMTASRHLYYPSLESLRAQSSDRCRSIPTSRIFKASFHLQLEAPRGVGSHISYQVEGMNTSLVSLGDWSNDSNLALNSKRPRRC